MNRHTSKILLAAALTAILSTAAYAHHRADHTSGGSDTDPGHGNDTEVFEFTVVTEKTDTYMGMSNNAPPNPHAAASQGTRTEETTTTTVYDVTVEGPHGQLKDYEPSEDLPLPEVDDLLSEDGCNNCIVKEVDEGPSSSETEITDLPGANR